ncbi:MAG: type II toxin-antitoxin system RelE/ParE family toxin [Lutibacter sp.]
MDRFSLNELEKTIQYLEARWTERELENLAFKLEETLILVSKNPTLFQVSDFKKDIRRVVILTHNTMYYRIQKNQIEIISFFSNRQSPKKRRLK